MLRAAVLLSSLVLLAAVAVATAAERTRTAPPAVAAARRAPSGTTIRFDGIGPLRLGMTRRAALATGWFRATGDTCLDGPGPLPQLARPDGAKAAPGVNFGAFFRAGANGRLSHLMFSSGARTELGIRPGVSTAAQMAARYRRAGFTVRTTYHREFTSSFVEVLRRRKVVMTGVIEGRGGRRVLSLIAIPGYFRC